MKKTSNWITDFESTRDYFVYCRYIVFGECFHCRKKQVFNSVAGLVALFFIFPYLFIAFPGLSVSDIPILPSKIKKLRNRQAETFARKVLLFNVSLLALTWAFVHVI